MPIITKITVQKKNNDRYNIFLDEGSGEKYAFSVDEAVLIKHGLKKGQELDEAAIIEIHYQDDIRKSYNLAIQYLSRRMRSEFEVKNHLRTKEVEEPIILEVIHKLHQYSFLNDEQFSIAYVRTQKNTTDKGSSLIKIELKEKGIAAHLIESALKEFSWEEELSTAISLCEKYTQKYKKDSMRMMKQKLEQMLVRKGFPYDIINEAISISDIAKEENEELSALSKQAEKYAKKYQGLPPFEYEQKMKQALFRKGFSVDLIDKYIQNQE
ncbi:recombination regulator RecX [Cytobacillus horneckiae]|uniref:recombination regulator RecX n=1 Tax=Cytobacillus horneckiae TaxID=549687 RepID=UPI003D9A766F